MPYQGRRILRRLLVEILKGTLPQIEPETRPPRCTSLLSPPVLLPISDYGALTTNCTRQAEAMPSYTITQCLMTSCNTDPPSAPSNSTPSLEDSIADPPANLDSSHPAGTNASIGVAEPEYFRYRELSLSECCWPACLVLDDYEDNWPEWSRRMTLLAARLHFSDWLNGNLMRPDPSVYPNAHRIWQMNNRALRALLLMHISTTDYTLVEHLQEPHAIFEELRKRHEQSGLYAQILLLQRLLDIHFSPTTPFSKTIHEIRQLFKRVVKMGGIDGDKLSTFFIITVSLGERARLLPPSLQAMINAPGFSPTALLQQLEDEGSEFMRFVNEGSRPAQAALNSTTFAIATPASGNSNHSAQKLVCSNCKRPNHAADFCIQPGGKMAGKSIDEARAAQRAASGKPPRNRRPRRAPYQYVTPPSVR
jgi:hypothetical protein